jgi:acetoin utilization deacetylase AcuC-like enzyme
MILYDPSLTMICEQFGIMLPVSASRADRIIEFLHEEAINIAQAVQVIYGKIIDNKDIDAIINREDLERVHKKEFVSDLFGANLERSLLTAWELIDSEGKPNRYEPQTATRPLRDLFQVVINQVAGSYLACRLALNGGDFCYYLAGGMHHARFDTGTGFCLVNDVMIAARKILAEDCANLIWIVDVDAHKGCGTAELVQFARKNGELTTNKNILNLSIHMAHGWPLDEETLAASPRDRAPHILCDVEIPIEKDAEIDYLPKLKEGIYALEGLSHGIKPDLVIVVAGSDPYEHDGLPSSALLRLTLEQCVARDMFVYTYLQERRIPSAWLMAGGYGDRAWEPSAYFLKKLQTAHHIHK